MRGKSMAVPQRQVGWQKNANTPPMVQFDFMYMTSEADLIEGDGAAAKAWSTVMVGVDENTGYPMSIVVDRVQITSIFMTRPWHSLIKCYDTER